MSGTGAIGIRLEASIDGQHWVRQASGLSLTPNSTVGQLYLRDDDASGTSVPGLSRYVRPVFTGDDTTNGGMVSISASVRLKRL